MKTQKNIKGHKHYKNQDKYYKKEAFKRLLLENYFLGTSTDLK